MRETPSPKCGMQVVDDVPRNFIETRESPSPNCGFLVVSGFSRNSIEKYERRRRQFVDSAS